MTIGLITIVALLLTLGGCQSESRYDSCKKAVQEYCSHNPHERKCLNLSQLSHVRNELILDCVNGTSEIQ